MGQTPSPFPPPLPTRKQGMGTFSLVSGILSLMCLGFLSGIPAIITGHIARARARKNPAHYGGAGNALAGLILGYIGTFLTTAGMIAIAAAIIIPMRVHQRSFQGGGGGGPRHQPSGSAGQCANHLRSVVLAARVYAVEHDEKLPASVLAMSNELTTATVLVCPDGGKTAASGWANFNEQSHLSYEFLTPGAPEPQVLNQAVFRCPVHGHRALGDGTVQFGHR